MNKSSYIPPIRNDANSLLQRDLRELFVKMQELQRMMGSGMQPPIKAMSNVSGLSLSLVAQDDGSQALVLNLDNRDALRTTLFIDQIALAKSNLSASTTPTVQDDTGKGYSVGSIWVRVLPAGSEAVYMCANPTIGAAVWRLLG